MPPEIEAGQDTPVVDNEAQSPAATPEETQKVDTPPADAAEGKADETAVPKTYSEEELQDRIERATAKAAAKAERRAFREAAARLQGQLQQHQSPPVDDKPRREHYADDEEYFDKLTDWKLNQREQQSRQVKTEEQNRSMVAKTEKLYLEAEKLPGFDRDDFESLPLTPVIAQVLIESDAGPKLMAYMTANPEEVDRISKLSPAKQAAEIGKLEAKLASTPVKTTTAPAPIKTIGASGKSSTDITKLSMEDYAAARAKQKPVWLR